MQNLVFAFFVGIGEAHVIKADRSFESLQRDWVRLFFNVVLVFKKSEDGARCAHGLLKAVVEVSELADRIVELEEQDDEGAKHAHGHAAVL